MKNVFTSGMILFLAMTTMVSCTQENVMLETTPQVKNQEVRFCFFEKSIVPIGQDEESNLARTRADGSEKSLKDAKLYTDLQVCLIPKGDETTAGYTVRQENWDDKFGNVSLQVPAGEYTLVAVAAKTDLQQEKRIEVKSRYEMTFANNIVRDMAYTLQDIKVESGSKAVTQNVSLKRAVSCFELRTTDIMPLTTKTQEITISGSCGTVFNPSTGFCKEKATITRNFSLEAKEHQERIIYYTLYTLLTDKDVTDIHITATAKDKEEKIIKTISFDNVHLVIGKKTTYTGPIFTYPANNMSFTVNQPEIPASGYDKKF
ncbi:FimB/Mfa2 family fimbrial subunit [Prevotella copri]|uniref:FimB/Mfa2 family fimbrial subunit n=1 Tax=Segatella copri TaxID=165179 RepID=A0AAW4YIL2_9BACT|nr:FimB/Mfa2 family fimbrial subunit [Segatella copri]MCE4122538.1 FimB/Mfa2 family fimbrial subunit [Segatella copri]MCP9499012.1 FimB/Mfa2 family fimbrial subunit [Segatella copri]MCP9513805.1 FimB/Mfa2 family fimbrial subunit [Segatella copri]MCP9522802.1 FimB/Mfa2 family fimbrial subunit [Segatella copri]